MYPVKQYVCLVDTYRRPSRWRNTRGRYRVGAKNEKEAKRLLQKAIGFGSVLVNKNLGRITDALEAMVKEQAENTELLKNNNEVLNKIQKTLKYLK